MPRLNPEILTAFATSIFEASELPPDVARQVAESLVLANLSGHDSHGEIRIIEYVAWTKRGRVNPYGQLTVLNDPWNLYLMALPVGAFEIRFAISQGVANDADLGPDFVVPEARSTQNRRISPTAEHMQLRDTRS